MLITRKRAEEMSIKELFFGSGTPRELESLEVTGIVVERTCTWLAARGLLNQFIDEKGQIGWQLHPKYKHTSEKEVTKLIAKWIKEQDKRG